MDSVIHRTFDKSPVLKQSRPILYKAQSKRRQFLPRQLAYHLNTTPNNLH